jgi:hypothetical protein
MDGVSLSFTVCCKAVSGHSGAEKCNLLQKIAQKSVGSAQKLAQKSVKRWLPFAHVISSYARQSKTTLAVTLAATLAVTDLIWLLD